MNRKTIWIALGIATLGLTLAAPTPRAFSLEKPFAASVPLTANGRETVYLHLAPDAKRLEVRARGQTQSLELTTMEDTERGSVLVDDFNFDGYADIAIPDGIGYGGVNYFYVLYAFQPQTNQFAALDFPGGSELCNPELRAATRTIETDCKSGPKYDFTDYRFLNGKPYTYRSAEMVILDGFNTDQYLVYNVSVFNPNGKRSRSSISDDPRREEAPLRYIPVDRAYLYDDPREDAKTSRYIIRNDAVRILEVRDVDGQQWLRIAYQSRTLGRIIKWISLGQ